MLSADVAKRVISFFVPSQRGIRIPPTLHEPNIPDWTITPHISPISQKKLITKKRRTAQYHEIPNITSEPPFDKVPTAIARNAHRGRFGGDLLIVFVSGSHQCTDVSARRSPTKERRSHDKTVFCYMGVSQ